MKKNSIITFRGKKCQLQGVGIDLVSVPRIRSFLKTHEKSSHARLLTTDEMDAWRKAKYSAITFAKFFTAKESYFKAADGSWMGLDGFSSLNVTLKSHDHFIVEPSDDRASNPQYAWGQYFRTRQWVGAQVWLWRPL